MFAAWLSTLKSGLARRSATDRISGAKPMPGAQAAWRRLYPYFRKHRSHALLGAMAVSVSTLLGFAPPMITRYLVDEVILAGRLGSVLMVVSLLAVCLAAEKILRLAEEFCFARFEQQMLRDIQGDLFTRTLSLPKAVFDAQQTGYLTRRLTEDVEGLRFLFSGTMFDSVGQLLRLAGGMVLLLYLEWRLALAVLACLPGLAMGLRYVSGTFHRLSRERLEYQAEAAGRIQESLAHSALIKAFAAETRSHERVMPAIESQLRVGLEQSLLGSLSATLIQAVPGAGRVVALAAGAVLIIRGEWTLGSLLAFQAYLAYVFGPAQVLASFHLQLQRARAALERVNGLFGIVPEDTQPGGLDGRRLEGAVEFRNVSFAYSGGDEVLKDVSLHIRPREVVAVMGPSGIGKTTLLSLLLRFYLPTRGEVYFDGRPAGDYELKSLRRRLGYVPQEPQLISGSIMENLRFGNPEAAEDRVRAAAAAAAIHETTLALPDGYAARVGEGGARLSAGERQRLALARALVVDPDILILDEPTSALDEKAEQSIMNSLQQWRRGRTVIVVTHRLATARLCDRIIDLVGSRTIKGGDCTRHASEAERNTVAN